MTKPEFAVFASALRTYYPREKLLPNDQAMELWFQQLGDLPFDIASAVLNKWAGLNKWSPAISDIREMAAEISCGGPVDDWGKSWELAMTAIRRYGFYDEPGAMASLPPMVRETVRRMGYRELCLSENQMADRANFRQIYEQLDKRERADRQLPAAVRENVAKLTAGFAKNLLETTAEARKTRCSGSE